MTNPCEYCQIVGHTLSKCKHPTIHDFYEAKKCMATKVARLSDGALKYWLNKEPLITLKVLCKFQCIGLRGNLRETFMDRVFQQFRIEREEVVPIVLPLPYYEIVSSDDDTSEEVIEEVITIEVNEIEEVIEEIEEVIQAPSNEIEVIANEANEIANEIEEVSRRPVRLRRQTVPFQQYMTRARRPQMIRTRPVITAVNTPVRVTCDKKNNKNNKNPFYEDECPICWDTKAYIRTQCGHKFCSCLMQLIVNPKQTEYGPAECKCPLCRAPVKSVKFKNNDYYTLLKSVSSGLACKIRCIS